MSCKKADSSSTHERSEAGTSAMTTFTRNEEERSGVYSLV